MESSPYTQPAIGLDNFHCPHCTAFASQGWSNPHRIPKFKHGQVNYGQDDGFAISMCSHCEKMCIWYNGKMLHPFQSITPKPNADLPNDIQYDYNEARQIASLSPRGAAALLRLAIQKLCVHLGENGKNINNDISSLVKKGLPVQVQQSLDIVRVVGNNAVHPGTLDIKDDVRTVSQLFHLINIVADVMITQPKKIANLYQLIVPEAQRNAITKRDNGT